MTGKEYDFPFTIMDVALLLKLRIKRPLRGSAYADCPLCGDTRGRMNLDTVNDRWRCNHCGEGGGMLKLYGMVHGLNNSEAYRAILDELQTGYPNQSYDTAEKETAPPPVVNSERASAEEIHRTLSYMLEILCLSDAHRANLRTRGLSDAQIDKLGYKSTADPSLCRSLTERLIQQGCVVQGVPGFYVGDDGNWKVNFGKRTAGLLIPIRDLDGKIQGCQIRLDVPLKNKDDPPEKEGAKYIWFASTTKYMGTSAGSPVHFVGDPFAKTVYVTEGTLKGDVANFLSGRSFVCIAGANNCGQLAVIFARLAQNGVQLIVESHDMDKFRNEQIVKGASKICEAACKCGLKAKGLTWNPNYKGVDDWQLALHTEKAEISEESFDNGVLRRFRVYQLEFTADIKPIKFAFSGINALRREGYEQPPASEYRLVFDSEILCNSEKAEEHWLKQIFRRYSGRLPEDYPGRSIAPSDVVELYSENERRYFYCDEPESFVEVKFSPMLALPMK